MRVLIDVKATAEVPDDTDLRLLSMTLQDSPTLLDEYLNQNGREVIVFSAPKRPPEETKD